MSIKSFKFGLAASAVLLITALASTAFVLASSKEHFEGAIVDYGACKLVKNDCLCNSYSVL